MACGHARLVSVHEKRVRLVNAYETLESCQGGGNQEAAAAYYRDLGLNAETDVTMEGVRGQHDIDVAVRGDRPGVEFLWIVECKLWNRRVPKSAVATLSSIVHDVGADRGIILSNSGFQAGAPMMATKNNITLTSLEELLTDTNEEYVEYQCAVRMKRCQAIIDAVEASGLYERIPGGHVAIFDQPSLGFDSRAGVLKTAIEQAATGDWPVTVIAIIDNVQHHARPNTLSDFLGIVDGVLGNIETEFALATRRFGDGPVN
jgi:hypothetical protein